MQRIEELQEQIEHEKQLRKSLDTVLKERSSEVDTIQAAIKQLHDEIIESIPEKHREQHGLSQFPKEDPNPVLRFSFSGDLLFANGPAKEILAVHPIKNENRFWLPFLQNRQLQKNKFEIEISVGDNTFILLFSPQFELGYVNVFGRDITKIKAAQKQLINNEARYRQIVENSSDIFYSINENGYFIYTNPMLSNITGYTTEAFETMHFSELIPSDYKKQVIQFYLKQMENRISSTYLELPIITKNGEELWIGQNCSISAQNNGKLELIAVGRNIAEKIKSNKQLKTATLRLSALIDNLSDGVLVEDEHGKIVLVNQSFCKLLSVSLNTTTLLGLDGQTFTKLFESQFVAANQFVLHTDNLREKKEMVIAEQLELTDGRIYERDYFPIFSDKGYLGNLWQYRNVTEKRKIQNSIVLNEKKYKGIIENMNLGLLEVDKNDIVLSANEQFCKIAGYTSSSEFIGKKATETFLDAESQKIMREQNEQRTVGNVGLYEVKIKKPNNEYAWVLICGAPLYDEARNVIGSIGIHLDISEQKKIEAALVEAKANAEASSKAKETFLANMSHEIRTPMNAIMGMSELLNGTTLETKQAQYIEAIRTSANNLLTIINDILDFSKIEAGELTLQIANFNLKKVVEHAINSLSYKAVEKSIMLKTEIDPRIHDSLQGDSVRVNQILLNLISNALKFTKEGSVKVSCTLIEDTPEFDVVEFKVTDTGIGIDPLKLEAIFESFSQEDGTVNRKYGGSGLGLTICKQLVKLMGGEIVVESKKGIGSTFLFTIKFKKEVIKMMDENIFQTQEKNLAGVKILLVEDNQINQLLATTVLKQWKAEVDVAINGIYAIESLKKKQYDMILMDIQMPEMGGIEATQIIRSELNIRTPIIAVTANALKGDREIYLEAGMDDYVSKPFEQNVLYNKICKYLSLTAPEKKPLNETINLNEMESETQQLYDLTEIRKISGGDKSFIKQMITIFLEQIPQSLAQILQAKEVNDFERIKSVAHQMKPSIDIMQIETLKKDVRFVEENAGNQTNLDQLPVYITKINNVLNKVMEQLKSDPEFKND